MRVSMRIHEYISFITKIIFTGYEDGGGSKGQKRFSQWRHWTLTRLSDC